MEFNRPVTKIGGMFDDHVWVHVPGLGWDKVMMVGAIDSHTVELLTAENWADRWKIDGIPDLIATDPPGFKFPIGGAIPYDRGWDP